MFTTIVGGLCAYVLVTGSAPYVVVGKIINKECREFMRLAHGDTVPPIVGYPGGLHTYGARIDDEFGYLTIDGELFKISRGGRA
jgi:hypothetical protein